MGRKLRPKATNITKSTLPQNISPLLVEVEVENKVRKARHYPATEDNISPTQGSEKALACIRNGTPRSESNTPQLCHSWRYGSCLKRAECPFIHVRSLLDVRDSLPIEKMVTASGTSPESSSHPSQSPPPPTRSLGAGETHKDAFRPYSSGAAEEEEEKEKRPMLHTSGEEHGGHKKSSGAIEGHDVSSRAGKGVADGAGSDIHTRDMPQDWASLVAAGPSSSVADGKGVRGESQRGGSAKHTKASTKGASLLGTVADASPSESSTTTTGGRKGKPFSTTSLAGGSASATSVAKILTAGPPALPPNSAWASATPVTTLLKLNTPATRMGQTKSSQLSNHPVGNKAGGGSGGSTRLATTAASGKKDSKAEEESHGAHSLSMLQVGKKGTTGKGVAVRGGGAAMESKGPTWVEQLVRPMKSNEPQTVSVAATTVIVGGGGAGGATNGFKEPSRRANSGSRPLLFKGMSSPTPPTTATNSSSSSTSTPVEGGGVPSSPLSSTTAGTGGPTLAASRTSQETTSTTTGSAPPITQQSRSASRPRHDGGHTTASSMTETVSSISHAAVGEPTAETSSRGTTTPLHRGVPASETMATEVGVERLPRRMGGGSAFSPLFSTSPMRRVDPSSDGMGTNGSCLPVFRSNEMFQEGGSTHRSLTAVNGVGHVGSEGVELLSASLPTPATLPRPMEHQDVLEGSFRRVEGMHSGGWVVPSHETSLESREVPRETASLSPSPPWRTKDSVGSLVASSNGGSLRERGRWGGPPPPSSERGSAATPGRDREGRVVGSDTSTPGYPLLPLDTPSVSSWTPPYSIAAMCSMLTADEEEEEEVEEEGSGSRAGHVGEILREGREGMRGIERKPVPEEAALPTSMNGTSFIKQEANRLLFALVGGEDDEEEEEMMEREGRGREEEEVCGMTTTTLTLPSPTVSPRKAGEVGGGGGEMCVNSVWKALLPSLSGHWRAAAAPETCLSRSSPSVPHGVGPSLLPFPTAENPDGGRRPTGVPTTTEVESGAAAWIRRLKLAGEEEMTDNVDDDSDEEDEVMRRWVQTESSSLRSSAPAAPPPSFSSRVCAVGRSGSAAGSTAPSLPCSSHESTHLTSGGGGGPVSSLVGGGGEGNGGQLSFPPFRHTASLPSHLPSSSASCHSSCSTGTNRSGSYHPAGGGGRGGGLPASMAASTTAMEEQLASLAGVAFGSTSPATPVDALLRATGLDTSTWRSRSGASRSGGGGMPNATTVSEVHPLLHHLLHTSSMASPSTHPTTTAALPFGVSSPSRPPHTLGSSVGSSVQSSSSWTPIPAGTMLHASGGVGLHSTPLPMEVKGDGAGGEPTSATLMAMSGTGSVGSLGHGTSACNSPGSGSTWVPLSTTSAITVVEPTPHAGSATSSVSGWNTANPFSSTNGGGGNGVPGRVPSFPPPLPTPMSMESTALRSPRHPSLGGPIIPTPLASVPSSLALRSGGGSSRSASRDGIETASTTEAPAVELSREERHRHLLLQLLGPDGEDEEDEELDAEEAMLTVEEAPERDPAAICLHHTAEDRETTPTATATIGGGGSQTNTTHRMGSDTNPEDPSGMDHGKEDSHSLPSPLSSLLSGANPAFSSTPAFSQWSPRWMMTGASAAAAPLETLQDPTAPSAERGIASPSPLPSGEVEAEDTEGKAVLPARQSSMSPSTSSMPPTASSSAMLTRMMQLMDTNTPPPGTSLSRSSSTSSLTVTGAAGGGLSLSSSLLSHGVGVSSGPLGGEGEGPTTHSSEKPGRSPSTTSTTLPLPLSSTHPESGTMGVYAFSNSPLPPHHTPMPTNSGHPTSASLGKGGGPMMGMGSMMNVPIPWHASASSSSWSPNSLDPNSSGRRGGRRSSRHPGAMAFHGATNLQSGPTSSMPPHPGKLPLSLHGTVGNLFFPYSSTASVASSESSVSSPPSCSLSISPTGMSSHLPLPRSPVSDTAHRGFYGDRRTSVAGTTNPTTNVSGTGGSGRGSPAWVPGGVAGSSSLSSSLRVSGSNESPGQGMTSGRSGNGPNAASSLLVYSPPLYSHAGLPYASPPTATITSATSANTSANTSIPTSTQSGSLLDGGDGGGSHHTSSSSTSNGSPTTGRTGMPSNASPFSSAGFRDPAMAGGGGAAGTSPSLLTNTLGRSPQEALRFAAKFSTAFIPSSSSAAAAAAASPYYSSYAGGNLAGGPLSTSTLHATHKLGAGGSPTATPGTQRDAGNGTPLLFRHTMFGTAPGANTFPSATPPTMASSTSSAGVVATTGEEATMSSSSHFRYRSAGGDLVPRSHPPSSSSTLTQEPEMRIGSSSGMGVHEGYQFLNPQESKSIPLPPRTTSANGKPSGSGRSRRLSHGSHVSSRGEEPMGTTGSYAEQFMDVSPHGVTQIGSALPGSMEDASTAGKANMQQLINLLTGDDEEEDF